MVDAAKHVDVDTLAGLKEIMEDDFSMLIDAFVMDSEAKIQEMDGAIASGDAESVRVLAHTVKGSSANVSAGPFAAIASQIEDLGREGTVAGAAELLTQLKTEFDAVVHVLRNEI